MGTNPLKWHALPIIALLLLIIGFFSPMILSGRTFQSPDWIAARSWSTAIEDAHARGLFPLWNPYIFCGMPAYGSLTFGGDRTFDVTAAVLLRVAGAFRRLALGFRDGDWLFYYFLYAAGIYLLAYREVSSRAAAIIAAASAAFSPSILNWAFVGHHTKIATLAFFPFVLLIARRLERGIRTGLLLLLVLALHYMLGGTHPQIVSYTLLALGLYWINGFAGVVRKRAAAAAFARMGLALAGATVVACLMSADLILSVMEYLPYSTRGSAQATAVSGNASSANAGLSYEYATSWSFAPQEVITFFVPSWLGFGRHEIPAMAAGVSVAANSYWGRQPFVDVPPYLGILTSILAALGLWRCGRQPFVRFLGILIGLALLLSFGREIPLVYGTLFRHTGLLNKFRAPAMILCLVQFAVPLLAAFGVAALQGDLDRQRDARRTRVRRLLLPILALASLASFAGENLVRRLHAAVFPLQKIAPKLAESLATTDASWVNAVHLFVGREVAADLQAAGLLILAGATLFRLARGKMIRPFTLAVLMLGLVCFDLWRVDAAPRDTTRADAPAPFGPPTGVFATLMRDTQPFRVLVPEGEGAVPANSPAFWRISGASGYHGAKMRTFQDLLDTVGLENPQLWRLMNVRYVLSMTARNDDFLAPAYRDGNVLAYRFRDELPRAFFVRRYEIADARETLRRIGAPSFSPLDVAFLADDPGIAVDPPSNGSAVRVMGGSFNDLQLHATATGNHLLFLSETYYPKGWRAFIDGRETPIHRANHHFRSLIVPPGSHAITLEFGSLAFSVGRKLSLWANIVFLGTCLILLFSSWKRRRRTKNHHQVRRHKPKNPCVLVSLKL